MQSSPSTHAERHPGFSSTVKNFAMSDWDCDSGRTIKPHQSGAGTPHRCNAKTRPQNVGIAEGGFQRRCSALTIAGLCFPFIGLVEVSCEHYRTELEAQVLDQEGQRDANRPPLGTLVVDVHSGVM